MKLKRREIIWQVNFPFQWTFKLELTAGTSTTKLMVHVLCTETGTLVGHITSITVGENFTVPLPKLRFYHNIPPIYAIC